jgi:spore maturation protein CgeB
VLPDYLLDEHGYFYQVKGRLFHAVGTATMALNDHFPELEEMFTIGKEIVAFQFGDIQDLRQKLEWYTKHDNERLRIARAGYERGRKEHTLGARVNQIIAAVNRLV